MWYLAATLHAICTGAEDLLTIIGLLYIRFLLGQRLRLSKALGTT